MKHLNKTAIAVMLACCGSPLALADTFYFNFSGNGGAKAFGSFTTTDTAAGSLSGAFTIYELNSLLHLTALSLTVSGAPTGNGVFSLSNFEGYVFSSSGALNFSTNLAGQANLLDLNWFGTGTAPVGLDYFTLAAKGMGSVTMILDCFYLQGAGNLCGYAGSSSPFVPYSTTRSAGAAAVLDSLNGGTGAMAGAITALGALTPTQQTAALEKLTPITSRALQVASQDSMSSAFAQVEQRLNGLRLAEGSFNAPSLVSTGSAVSGLSAGDETSTPQGMWLKGYGLDGHQGEKNGYAGYSSSGWGVAVGADRQFAPGLIGGVALSYSDTSVSYNDQLNGDSNGVKSTQLSLYGSQDFGRFYVDGMLAYAQQRYDSKRDTVVNGYATGHFDGDQWGARIGAGLPIALSDDTSDTPLAHIEWLQLKQSSYTESGGGALGLRVGSNSADRVRSTLGAQVEHNTVVGSVNARPFVRAFWNHDFKNDGVNSTASFVGGGSSFVTPGQKLDRDSFSIGAGVNFYAKKDFSATLAYDLTLGSSYHADALQATARWNF